MSKRYLTAFLLLSCTAFAHTASSKDTIKKGAQSFGGLACQTYQHSDSIPNKPIPVGQLKAFYSDLVKTELKKPGVKSVKEKITQSATLFTGERITKDAAGRAYSRTEFDLKGGAAVYQQTNSCHT